MAARLTAFVVVAIVAVTLIAGLIVGAQRDDSDGPVDVIVHNARVYTADTRRTNGRSRGHSRQSDSARRHRPRDLPPQASADDDDRRASGATVLPGFNDAARRSGRRRRGQRSDRPARRAVAGRCRASRARVGGGESGSALGARPRLAARAVRRRPAHAPAARSAGAGSAGAAPERRRPHGVGQHPKPCGSRRSPARQPHPRRARSCTMRRTGEPTGLLEGSALALVERLVPAPTAGDRERALRTAIATAQRHGVTSIQDVADGPEDLAVYASARRTGDLQVRVYAALPVTSDLPDADLDQLEVTTRKFPDDPLLKAGAVSVPLDGGVPSARRKRIAGGYAALRRGHVEPTDPAARRAGLADPDRSIN